MKRSILIILALCAFPSLAAAYQSLAATVRVSSGSTYDYVIIGESPLATDGFDNAYDTIAPGASLNNVWISAYFDHPEWNAVKRQFRGDIRSAAASQTWVLTVEQNLPAGTFCTISLDAVASILPMNAGIILTDPKGGATVDLKAGSYTFAATAGPSTFDITITQPDSSTLEPVKVDPAEGPHDGDLDGDGYVSVMDAYKVLRVAYHLDPLSAADLLHGDLDGDGSIRLADVLYILRKVAGTI